MIFNLNDKEGKKYALLKSESFNPETRAQ